MRYLLDTCTLLWWWSDSDRLSKRVRVLISDPENRILVSAASAWEISTKYRIGKYPAGGRIIPEWDERLDRSRFMELPINAGHALRAGSIHGDHRDPFDRMVAAQGLIEDLSILSPDIAISDLGASVIW